MQKFFISLDEHIGYDLLLGQRLQINFSVGKIYKVNSIIKSKGVYKAFTLTERP